MSEPLPPVEPQPPEEPDWVLRDELRNFDQFAAVRRRTSNGPKSPPPEPDDPDWVTRKDPSK